MAIFGSVALAASVATPIKPANAALILCAGWGPNYTPTIQVDPTTLRVTGCHFMPGGQVTVLFIQGGVVQFIGTGTVGTLSTFAAMPSTMINSGCIWGASWGGGPVTVQAFEPSTAQQASTTTTLLDGYLGQCIW
jgi:hypothetical protein